jgi:nucleoporin NUP159
LPISKKFKVLFEKFDFGRFEFESKFKKFSMSRVVFSNFGQPSFGGVAFGEPSLSGVAFGKPSFGDLSFGGMAFGKPSFGGVTFGGVAFGEPSPRRANFAPS